MTIAARIEIAAALLRRTCQFFDSGGESMRSTRAMCAEAAFHLLDNPAFRPTYIAAEDDCWALINKARSLERGVPDPDEIRSVEVETARVAKIFAPQPYPKSALLDDIQRLVDQHVRQFAVPAGWQLVPVEPTEEMLEAGCKTCDDQTPLIWEAMLAAAPPAQGRE